MPTPEYVHILERVITRATPAFLEIPGPASATRPAPDRWSPREIIGHLVDSASNNHQRFVRAQLQDDLVFPGYAQNEWVSLQRYQDAPWHELVTLWRAFNLHLVRVMSAIPDEVRLRPRRNHSLNAIGFKINPDQPARLDDLMSDYVVHLIHHVEQVLGAGWCNGSAKS